MTGRLETVLIAVGSNQRFGVLSPVDLCRAAWACVVRLPDFAGVAAGAALSPLYGTRPLPDEGQADFVNAVGCIWLERSRLERLDPAGLLGRLAAIEALFGRVRGLPNASRTLDLDLVAIGGLVREAPDPMLPHPRCGMRRFVLEPLAQLVPDWRHPVSGRTVEQLLAALPDQGVRPLA